MSDDFFTFEQSPWDTVCDSLKKGSRMTAGHFLALLEGEPEEVVEDAFRTLERLEIVLDLSDLPVLSGAGESVLRLKQEAQLVRQGNLLNGLEENDPLRVYLEELAAIPTFGDTDILAAEAAAGNKSAGEQLVNCSLSRVVSLAGEYTGRGVLLLDLIQEGSMALWQGIQRYRAGDFSAQCDIWIRGAMVKAVTEQARANGVGQKMRQAMEDYRSADEKLLIELGRSATLEEIAEAIHMTAEETGYVQKMIADARLLAQARADSKPRKEEPEEEEQAVEDTAYFQSRQRVEELLSDLSEQDAKILTLRFGLEGGLPQSPEETGRKLGLTPEEVVSREAAALSALRRDS